MKRYGSHIPEFLGHNLTARDDGEWVRYAEIVQLQKWAQEVARLLELGDQRLLTSDGPCGGQNAAAALSPKESAKLYQTCQKIAAEAAGS